MGDFLMKEIKFLLVMTLLMTTFEVVVMEKKQISISCHICKRLIAQDTRKRKKYHPECMKECSPQFPKRPRKLIEPWKDLPEHQDAASRRKTWGKGAGPAWRTRQAPEIDRIR